MWCIHVNSTLQLTYRSSRQKWKVKISKTMILRVLKKIAYFCLLLHLFIVFRNISILTYIYSFCILTFKSWFSKTDFLAVTYFILAIFRIIFQKNCHNWWHHHPYSCNFEKIFLFFFCNIIKYGCAKFHAKSIFLSRFTQRKRGRGALCAPLRGMIRQKYPGYR